MSSSFNIASHNFVGPIELLLQLVKKRKLHINEVGLSEVADSFLEHFRSMPDMTLHHATHFLTVAATLVYVKSKALFPDVEVDEDSEEALAQLVDRVRLFALIQERVPILRERETAHFYTRKPTVVPVVGFQIEPRLTSYVLRSRIEKVLRSSAELARKVKTQVTKKIKPRIALATMMTRVKDRISGSKTRFSLKELIDDFSVSHERKDASISGFLAALEMVKQQDVYCEQVGVFSEIIISNEFVYQEE